jgi:NAD(P)-dependent dehydrogenase (short-subunit alcohol dehydrogenase family)
MQGMGTADVVVITGGAGGIGSCVARLLHTRGYTTVYLLDIDPQVETLAAELGYTGIVCDMAEPANISAAFAPIPRCDVLISCVGIAYWGDDPEQNLHQLTQTMAVNWQAPFLSLMAAVERGMQRAIIISSTIALYPLNGAGTYSASKAALHASIRTWRYHPAIYPRPITEIMPIQTQTRLIEQHHPERLPLLVRHLPKLQPQTVARVIVRTMHQRYPPQERVIPWYTATLIRLLGQFSRLTPLMNLWRSPKGLAL